MKKTISRQTLSFAIIFVLLGINMYWSAIIVDPIREINERQLFLARIAITQNEKIIELLQPANTTENATKEIIVDILKNSTNETR